MAPKSETMKNISVLLGVLFLPALLHAQSDTLWLNKEGLRVSSSQAHHYIPLPAQSCSPCSLSAWYVNGTLYSSGVYRQAQAAIKEGYFTFFDESGRLSEKGLYRNGLRDSIWEFYSITGRVKEKRRYQSASESFYSMQFDTLGNGLIREGKVNALGHRDGPWIEYHYRSVQIKKKWFYRDGIPEGKQVEYDSQGWLHREEIYRNGRQIRGRRYTSQGKRCRYYPAFQYPRARQPIRKYLLQGPDSIRCKLQKTEFSYTLEIDREGRITKATVLGVPDSLCCHWLENRLLHMKRWHPARRENETIPFTVQGKIRYFQRSD